MYVTASFNGKSTRVPSLYVSVLTANVLATLATSVIIPPPRCVKCNQPHATRVCKKSNCTPPKCVNCGGAQPDNFTDCRSHTQPLSSLHRRQSRVTKPTTSALQLKQAHFIAFKPTASPPRLHTTWAQIESQPPTKTDPQSHGSLLDTVKSFLSVFNIQNICHTLRSLVLRLQRSPLKYHTGA